jgi:predicted CopG family antitoxin
VYVYVYTEVRRLASKNISITEDVYDLLSKMKLEDESFSDTITRLVKGGGKLSDCAGLWSDMDEEELGEILANTKEMRKTVDESLRQEAGIV